MFSFRGTFELMRACLNVPERARRRDRLTDGRWRRAEPIVRCDPRTRVLQSAKLEVINTDDNVERCAVYRHEKNAAIL